MKRPVTHLEAWVHFYTWAKSPENWDNIDRAGRDRIGKAQRRYRSQKPAPLGANGVRSIIEKYAPAGVYEFNETVFINE